MDQFKWLCHLIDGEVNLSIFNNKTISGFIGFSNGAFFLNKPTQVEGLNALIVSVGGGGYIEENVFPNQIYLITGKQNTNHYDNVQQFYNQSKRTKLRVKIIVP